MSGHRQNADIADTLHLREVAMATIFGFLYMGSGAHWRHLKNTTEPSMCGGDAALCQITLTTCFTIAQVRLRCAIAHDVDVCVGLAK